MGGPHETARPRTCTSSEAPQIRTGHHATPEPAKPSVGKRLDDPSPAEWADLLVVHLEDGVPRTFNRLMVELFDTTADVAFGTAADDGLWLAVEDGRLEYTLSAPVYFRTVRAIDR